MACFILFHLWKVSKNDFESKLIFIFSIIGTIIDSLVMQTRILSYEGLYSSSIPIAPLWITAMWCGFAATVNHSMSWLDKKWLLSILLGAVFGPLSYITAAKFEAISLSSDITMVVGVLALVWGLSMPLIFWVNDKIKT
tara:strand:- start:3273 stop:3689 length:417 start_codon:yes stop_codon:yes gene_type:complete